MRQHILRLSVLAIVVSIVVLLVWANSDQEPQLFPVRGASAPISTFSETETSEKPPANTPASSISYTSDFKSTMTTYFFVGEPADASNAHIPNDASFWDDAWLKHFGGVDDPLARCGFSPCRFTPLENPFYVALPYAEFDAEGTLKDSAKRVPWYRPGAAPLLKNQWVEIVHDGHVCYGQWEDVGPNGEDDFAYVFGSSAIPSNTFGERAGLDVSPALWKCLGMTDNDITSWRFVGASAVPSGPWKDTVTSSATN